MANIIIARWCSGGLPYSLTLLIIKRPTVLSNGCFDGSATLAGVGITLRDKPLTGQFPKCHHYLM